MPIPLDPNDPVPAAPDPKLDVLIAQMDAGKPLGTTAPSGPPSMPMERRIMSDLANHIPPQADPPPEGAVDHRAIEDLGRLAIEKRRLEAEKTRLRKEKEALTQERQRFKGISEGKLEAIAQALGVSVDEAYQRFTAQRLGIEKADTPEAKVEALRRDLEAEKAAREDDKKRQAGERASQEDRLATQIVDQLIKEKPDDFQFVQKYGRQADAIELRKYLRSQEARDAGLFEEISQEEALRRIEAHLDEIFTQALDLPKVKAKISKPNSTDPLAEELARLAARHVDAPNPDRYPPAPPDRRGPARTLTNGQASAPARTVQVDRKLTDEERLELATNMIEIAAGR